MSFLVEGQGKAVAEFYLHFPTVALYLAVCHAGILGLYELFYVCGDNGDGQCVVLAVHFFPFSVAVELYFCTVGQHYLILFREELTLDFDERNLRLAEVPVDEVACCKRQLFGIHSDDVTCRCRLCGKQKRNQDCGNLFHCDMSFSG